MGYNTDFRGQVKVTPPLEPHVVEELRRFAGTRHEGDEFPGLWCKWEATGDGTGIEWNGAEKFYDAEHWLAYLMKVFLKDREVTGVIEAAGEEPDDVWRIEMRDNTVHVVRRVTYPRYEEIAPGDPYYWTDEQKAEFDARTRRDFVYLVRDGRLHEVGPAETW
jgi:hypothetical protein